MEANQQRPLNMIDTTDALEAVNACQAMKNFLFVLILIGLVLCQTVFWMNHFGLVTKEACSSCQSAGQPACPSQTCPEPRSQKTGLIFLAATTDQSQQSEAAADNSSQEEKSVEQTIDEIVESANETESEAGIELEKETDTIPAEIPAETADPETQEPQPDPEVESGVTFEKLSLFRISARFAKGVVAVCNFIIIAAVILYCLTLLMCLKISLASRLGGINHIARAFFISLFLLVALIPWQSVLPGVLVGAVWRPGALWCDCWARADSSIFWKVMLYLRFCGLPFVAVWLLLWTQIRSGKWTRATLRRLGVLR